MYSNDIFQLTKTNSFFFLFKNLIIMENFVPTQKLKELYKEAPGPCIHSAPTTINPSVLPHSLPHPIYSEANLRNHIISLVNASVTLKERLHQVFVAACRIFICSMGDLVP